MERVTVRYVRFLSPGSFYANYWMEPVDSVDPQAVKWPENAYAFTMHERVDMIDGPETFTGGAEQIGPVYYHPDSKVLTKADVVAKGDPRDRILVQNMECNGWTAFIYSRWGNWPQPYKADKVCILNAA